MEMIPPVPLRDVCGAETLRKEDAHGKGESFLPILTVLTTSADGVMGVVLAPIHQDAPDWLTIAETVRRNIEPDRRVDQVVLAVDLMIGKLGSPVPPREDPAAEDGLLVLSATPTGLESWLLLYGVDDAQRIVWRDAEPGVLPLTMAEALRTIGGW